MNRPIVVGKLDHLFCSSLWHILNSSPYWRPTGFQELHVFPLTVLRLPIDVKKWRQVAFDGSRVEPQWNEAALLVERVAKPERAGLQLRPFGAEGIRRHADDEDAGVLQPLLDLRRDAVASGDFPVIEPNAQAVRPQPLGNRAHDRLVLRAVAEEDVVFEIVRHGSPLAVRLSESNRSMSHARA
jgi:hypothetical protein